MNIVIHFEIPAENPEVSMKFYKEIFGWKFNQFTDQPYWLAITGDEKEPGINGAIMKRNHPEQPLTNSIRVADIDKTMQIITEKGGIIVVPKTEIPGMGWFCYFKDPDNNILGLMQMI